MECDELSADPPVLGVKLGDGWGSGLPLFSEAEVVGEVGLTLTEHDEVEEEFVGWEEGPEV